LEDTILSLALRAHQKGLELVCHLPTDVPRALVGDPGRLRQVIVNLLGNAIKFTERGEVALKVALVTRGEAGLEIQFTVSDTGIGIPASKRKLIFEAFTQADSSTTRTYGGTGLGLAISSQLVELMGGRLWVESEEGSGSSFQFTARFALQKNPQSKTAPLEVNLRGMPALIVDDNATNRQILREFLLKWEMKPEVADGAEAAMKLLEAAESSGQPFPVVLLDAMMPLTDGFTLARCIKDSPNLAGTVIMMLSSAAQVDDSARCRELGISLYVTKPVRQSELLDAVMSALGGELRTTRMGSAAGGSSILKSSRPMRILLAEDNPVNQRLAVRILEKWGHSVVVTGNGRKALEAWENERFDVVLMDVQMPEMSGIEATREIREREKPTGQHTPIIAMTAHAMEGDREKCLSAGMDQYVTKPIDQKRLFEAVECVSLKRPPTEAPDMNEPDNQLQFDPGVILKRVDGDLGLLKEIADLFVEDTPRLLSEVRNAIARGDGKSLERTAHTLKGSVGNFGARSAFDAALQLEQMGRNGDFARADETFARLEQQVNLLVLALELLMKEKAA
jgi:CheY-like chemotaxis protein